MSPEKELEIINCAKWMFEYEGSKDIQQSLLAFGFCCGDGWFNLIKNLTIDIAKEDSQHLVHVLQVKEKYGTLRYYISGGNDKIDKLISKAEEDSANICEICGDEGTINYDFWLSCRCNKCREE